MQQQAEQARQQAQQADRLGVEGLDLQELVEILSGESVRLPTAALAHLQLDIQDWQDLNGEEQGKLVNLWTPREHPLE